MLDARAGTTPEPWPGAAALAGAGFRTVRVPACWTDHLASDGSIDAGFAARVDAVVDELLAHDLEVVLDVHHFDAVHADAAGRAPVLAELWRQLARRYAEHSPALLFELLNEPRAPMTPAAWNRLAASTLAAIRDVDARRRVVIGPAAANTLDALEELQPPDDPELILTVHYYAPFRFTHQGAEWEPGADAWLGTTWGDEVDHEAVTADLERAAAWATRQGRPLFVGEFGTREAADRASRLRWTGWVRREAERLQLGWCYWALGTEFRLMHRDGSWDADLLDALLGTSPDRG
jgi:endoglucanase